MARRFHLATGVAVMLGVALAAPAEERLYHLAKVPKFRVGDRAIVKATHVRETTVGSRDQPIVQKQSGDEHMVWEVLRVSRDGQVQAFRLSLVSLREQTRVTGMGALSGGKDVALRKIHFVVRRDGMHFDADTTSVVAEDSRALKASEVLLLKQHCRVDLDFPGHYEPFCRLLLPAKPVPVGHTQKSSPDAIREWNRVNPFTRRTGLKLLTLELTLASVTDGLAAVRVGTRFRAPWARGKDVVPVQYTNWIDTRSGRCAGVRQSWASESKSPPAALKTSGRREETVTYVAGGGKPSALPAGLTKLGWKPPGRDRNSHRNRAQGFSLNLPKGFRLRAATAKEGPVAAAFTGPRDGGIIVRALNMWRPVDLDEIARLVVSTHKKALAGFRISGQERLSLSDNTPALLMTATAKDAKVVVLDLMALSPGRAVWVIGTAPAGNKALQAELREAFKTLRVFRPGRGGR